MKKMVSDLLSGVLQTFQALKEKTQSYYPGKWDITIIGCQ